MSKRNPAVIAGELKHKIENANSLFVPVNVREGLDLAAEFMDAVSTVLIEAGLITDPSAAPAAETPAAA